LVVEDSLDDFDILIRELRRIGYAPHAVRVETAESMSAALRDDKWDVVISDWSMPQFSGLEALSVLQGTKLDLPFLFASGTVGEEAAVEALRSGAHDFLLKDRLARLGVAIERERREAAVRTERAKMQEQLMISDRMASVGILAAGVAHEINNPLAAVLANLDLALADLAMARTNPEVLDGIREELSDARTAADRVRRIVRDLRIFSRSAEEKLGPIDVHTVLESTLRMAANEIRHRATLVKDYGSVPPVSASEGRLGQVFLNLIVNASQALPEGHADSNQIRIRTRCSGDRVAISISDTGPGLPATVMQQLFTPFVTTKPAGIGTGLGLSICHRIVTGFGGEIRVDSSAAGTTFEVVLLSAEDLGDALPAAPAPIVAAPRRGRILTIDDEPMISRAIFRVVGKHHDVQSALSGSNALAMIRDGLRFDVIICDLMMPEITGMDLHAELCRIAPDQAASMIFLTGGAFTTGAQEFLDAVPNLRLDKPFEPAQLLSLINDIVR
jgi:signal transduction histidine kinase